MSKKNTTTSNVDVEALVAKTTNLPTAEVVSSALASLQKKQAEEKEKEVVENISLIQRYVSSAVRGLQRIRQSEKEAKKKLQCIADAEAEFLKTGDMDAFYEATKEYGLQYGW